MWWRFYGREKRFEMEAEATLGTRSELAVRANQHELAFNRARWGGVGVTFIITPSVNGTKFAG